MELTDNQKIEILNSLKVFDYRYSCSGCDYVLVEDNEKNRNEIKKIGLTDEIIDGYVDRDYIDISLIAWNYTNANWWKKDTGFFDQRQKK
ncbi:hypothetical protein [Lutispora thermophila]|uniref:Uncharacterized protein n=1 Tax=Lutispora thermophila DSM 19022 TaxID=1122184 RepID=A0A1M6GTP0_9FIRM|nr:hypothetical protein [Lutispora thermophila]SHJ13335.1 hypothetical protein SAMN02745176_02500 [Lutispora thermophila DSM 19022]